MTEIIEQAPEQTATAPAVPDRIKSRKGALKTCKCADFEVGVTTGSDEEGDLDATIETTGCTRQTNRLFAQGHDAKLVSFLVNAAIEGKEIRYGRATGTLVHSDPIGACRTISEALAAKAQAALNRAEEKQIARQAREDTKRRRAEEKKSKPRAPRQVAVRVVEDAQPTMTREDAERVIDEAWARTPIPAAPEQQDDWTEQPAEEPKPVIAKIKVGRWEYGARLNDDGSATYVNRDEQEVTVPEGKWKLA